MPTGSCAQDISAVRTTIEDALRVVDEQLDAARLRSGAVRELRPETVDLNILFAELRGMYRALNRTADVRMTVRVAPGMAPLVTDRHFLAQVLRNLLTNAAKFTDRGEIALRAADEGAEVVVSVADTGIGIDPADHERIFEEFAQIDGAQTDRRAGTGLGLPLVRSLVVALGGAIAVQSTPGEGTTFTLRLPRAIT